MPVKDLTGQKFNRWTVIERAPNNSCGDAMWLCECSCPAHTRAIVKGAALRSGHSKSCGCLKKEKAAEIGRNNTKDLTGQKFGKLTVLEKAYSKNYSIYWKCQCDCGNISYVTTDHLMSGHTKTCGCGKEAFNLTGQTFGSLTAIKIIGKSTSGDNIWECICSCPSHNIVYRTASSLVQGKATSCGCEKKSKSLGEDKIAILLTGADIPFKREQSFEDLRDTDTNGILRFDFFVSNTNGSLKIGVSNLLSDYNFGGRQLKLKKDDNGIYLS